MRTFFVILLVSILLISGVFLASKPKKFTFTKAEMHTTIKTPKHWGAFAGSHANDEAELEKQIGHTPHYYSTFVHWGSNKDFPSHLSDSINKKEQVLVIFWEAMDYSKPLHDQAKFSYQSILRGEHDEYIKSFAAQARLHRGEIILIPFEEMNGDWHPWSITKNGNTKEDYINAYKHVQKFFTVIPNVKLGWSVNAWSIPNTEANQIENYYPGDDVVQYVGVNGFNFGNPWVSYDELFKNTLNKLKEYNKPIIIFSMASKEGEWKVNWLQDALNKIQNTDELEGFIWFNEKKERDWRIWSDDRTLEVFRNSVQGPVLK